MKVNFKEIEKKFRPDNSGHCTIAEDGLIATQSAFATEIGKQMLKQNGNAADAAVAARSRCAGGDGSWVARTNPRPGD